MIRILITAILILLWNVLLIQWGRALAVDRKNLDECEAILILCYESCKKHHTAEECNRRCTTKLCPGISWDEPIGRFQDRRIEESAAPHPDRKVFIGLNRLRPTYFIAGGK